MLDYLEGLAQKFARTDTAKGREMLYRSDFEGLLARIFDVDGKVIQINHDSTNDQGNKPDFVVSRNSVPVLYIEAKDISVNLDKVEKTNQLSRYFGYDNLVLTDYVEFRFFRNGLPYGESIRIANVDTDKHTIAPIEKNFDFLRRTLLDFTASHKEPIKRGNHLAQIMGGKAQRIRDNILDMLEKGEGRYEELAKIEKVVRENLVSDLDHEHFADLYAQTLVYGLFAARYNDPTPESFSREEARDLISKTNPFLRDFFDHIAGASFPERLRFIVDELCEVFTHANVENLLTDFYGKEKDHKDPVIHFYEDFLREYDSKKKMEMGVFYTPQPVVRFIVQAVDEVLKAEFGLARGLSDTTKIQQKQKQLDPRFKKEKTVLKDYHRVQILDVATGTGTFLNEVVQLIHEGFAGQEGQWPSYAIEDLLPRLHGFELMMASYTIAHLKLGMALHESGVPLKDKRLGIYLTNTLEDAADYSTQGTLFGLMDSIAEESKSASRIKAEYPIMCLIGNPPYSGISQNKNYTDNKVYKVEPGGRHKLQEKKNWLDDDYVKFIRFAESMIAKNGEGVVGMITAHGYIDNPTFRGMRWHLRTTFDKLYIIDLHGNSNKKEVSPDGSKDENVFDIKTGVAIIIGVKTGEAKGQKKALATVYKTDLYGTRKSKLSTLEGATLSALKWDVLPDEHDVWKVEGIGKKKYQEGFSVVEMCPKNTTGIVTARDSLVIDLDKSSLISKIKDFCNDTRTDLEVRKQFFGNKKAGKYLPGDSRGWKLDIARQKIRNDCFEGLVQPIIYRPFDTRYVYYSQDMVDWGRWDLMKNFINYQNIGICVPRLSKGDWGIFYVKDIVGHKVVSAYDSNSLFPLYIYSENGKKIANLNDDIWQKINDIVGETTPENILDYIYAVLHSPRYRREYGEFLKSDFPRVPYPESKELFWSLVALGTRLRELHLMTAPESESLITTYPVSGDNLVEKVRYEEGRVYINDTQFFGGVSDSVWYFYIGGYRPAEKYLKDRKERALTGDEIRQYQKIIVALSGTIERMREIDQVWSV